MPVGADPGRAIVLTYRKRGGGGLSGFFSFGVSGTNTYKSKVYLYWNNQIKWEKNRL